ncbi:beta-glucosidase D [Penicillium longicatenatum]|uniref:beta-glucosidase D n=1 Tax=Penicillium longicatenatum TaxID=1561947 RepID=UPI002547A2F4|nr:beta-glucosidase D [Penicillium longicatenatum]KAJ5649973.1 beta-glucosidase D [Penicillium longicatenatum]
MKIHSLSFLSLCISSAVALRDNASTGLLSTGDVSLGDWQPAYKKAVAFVSKLNTTEKIKLITGNDAEATDGSHFTALEFMDGDMGLQDYFYVSAFSLASAISMTWDKDAIYEQAKAVGTEFYNKGIQVIDGPTSQPLGRTVWGGRLVETMGSDPYLNGIATGLTAKGYKDVGIISGIKHFILNEQETNRTASMGQMGQGSSGAPYSSNVDSKTFHETYLWSFYDGVHSGLGGVMCAMTKVNGTLSCESSSLLLDTLKTELGFPGLVFPDTNGQEHALASAVSGLDYSSSTIWSSSNINGFLENNTMSEARLNDMAVRNLMGYYHVGLDNGKQRSTADEDAYLDVRANHSKLIRAHGAKSMVLLKNTDNALPLKKPHKMAIFGAHARAPIAGPNMAFSVMGSGPTYDGHLASGSGSGQGSLPYLITPEVALTLKASQDGTMLRWVANDTYSSSGGSTLVMQGSDSTSVTPSISNYAENMDVCLVFLNALAGEGADRTELTNADQDSLVKEVAENCANTVVVINTVGARLVDEWIENENVTAVLYGSLLGEESGYSIVDVLYGDVNPSGRLIYTIAKNASDYNVDICYTANCNFTEGNYIDYRYFDAYNVTPRYEFGYGLSYTNFTYSSLNIDSPSSLSRYPTGKLAVGGYEDLWDNVANVSAVITNSGTIRGADVPQLYIKYPASAKQPLRQLRGFENVNIAAGKQTQVEFGLRRRDISHWDVAAQKWAVAPGTYTVYVGASSRDLRLHGSFRVETKA